MCSSCGYGARPDATCFTQDDANAGEYDGPPDPVDSDGRL